jgi:hypothetical protein
VGCDANINALEAVEKFSAPCKMVVNFYNCELLSQTQRLNAEVKVSDMVKGWQHCAKKLAGVVPSDDYWSVFRCRCGRAHRGQHCVRSLYGKTWKITETMKVPLLLWKHPA